MTAPAATLTSAPAAPATPRAASHPPADRFAFAAMLDSLPGGAAKAGDAIPEKQPHPLDERPQEHSPHGQATDHSLTNDNALFASLPFALRAALMMEDHPQSAEDAPALTPHAMKGPNAEDSGAPIAAGAKAPAVGRLIGERAFHLGASVGAIASRAFQIDTSFASGVASSEGQSDLGRDTDLVAGFQRTEAMPAAALAAPGHTASVAASVAPRASVHPTNRANSTKAVANEAARAGQKPEGSPPPPVARAAASAAPVARAESSAKTTDLHLPDSTASAAPSRAQTDPFGAPSLASFAAGASFEVDAPPRDADTDIAPRASTRAGIAASASPVREIDVDLSPGGLEDVSMTMRLTGDKLSVVIRAASSQTLGSIEGARDAITDRMAAIGQPLDSLIVKQAGVNTDGNANGNSGGSAESERRPGQGAGERDGSNDALSRRGAGRDRSF